LKVVIDENVPLSDELFGAHAELIHCNGRSISKDTLYGAQALIVRSVTPVVESLVRNTPIEFIGSCTAGIDHIDTEFADVAGIEWCYAPGCNAQSVAEYVTSSLAALNALGTNKRAGIVGCGNIGRAVYDELSKFGMDVVAYDPFLTERQESRRLTTLDDLLSSDIVCLHTPYTDRGLFPTKAMIGSDQLRLMKPNAVLISAGRGGVLDEQAMHLVAEQRPDIRWVMDVWNNEPSIDSSSLNTAVIATPHIAGYSLEGKQNGSWQVYQRFCQHFGLKPKVRNQCLDAASKPKYSSINEMLLSVYDPFADTELMRSSYEAISDEGKKLGNWFDGLRRNYPERRERSAYCFDGNGVSPKLRKTAESLGFAFVDRSG